MTTESKKLRVLGYWTRYDHRWLISEIGGRAEGRIWYDCDWQVAADDDPNEWGDLVQSPSLEVSKAAVEAKLKARGFVLITDLVDAYLRSQEATK